MRRHASLMPPRRRFLLIALVLSVCAHLAAALLIVALPHMLPRDAQPQEPSTVELLMVEQKGTHSAQPAQPNDTLPAPKPSQAANAPAAEEQKTEAATPASRPAPALPLPKDGDEPAALPAIQIPPTVKADAAEAKAEPTPPRPQEAPVFDLEGTGSESNAMVLGGRVLPAMKDDRFRNQPPAYPAEAEVRGEHGAVVVLIHVAANGAAAGADILESSGHEILDQAAVAAVQKWHFRPAMEAGRAVPSTMPFRFIFEP